MQPAKVPYLKSVAFSDILYWDVKRYARNTFQSQYPIKALNKFIVERSAKVKPFKFPNKDFSFLGVNNKVGLFDAYIEKGNKIKQPYKRVCNGDLVYNPYRVNVGSIGWKTDNQKHEFVSPAYVIFHCDKGLESEFLYRLFRTRTFNQIIDDSTTGSVRQNLKFETLSQIKIPIPPAYIQQELLLSLNRNLQEAKELDRVANEREIEIEEYILKELKISVTRIADKVRGLHFFNYKDCGRWAVDYMLGQGSIAGLKEGKYPVVAVRDFLISYQYGISVKATRIPVGIPVLRMNNINNAEVIADDLKYIILDESEKGKLLLEKGDLLFNRTNSKALVGKTAVFDEDGEYTFASYIIRLKLDTSKVDIHYINYLFNSQVGRVQIDMISRQILGQANVNSQELRDFVFPIPPLNIQRNIGKRIRSLKSAIWQLRNKSDMLRERARESFEAKVFSNEGT